MKSDLVASREKAVTLEAKSTASESARSSLEDRLLESQESLRVVKLQVKRLESEVEVHVAEKGSHVASLKSEVALAEKQMAEAREEMEHEWEFTIRGWEGEEGGEAAKAG